MRGASREVSGRGREVCERSLDVRRVILEVSPRGRWVRRQGLEVSGPGLDVDFPGRRRAHGFSEHVIQ